MKKLCIGLLLALLLAGTVSAMEVPTETVVRNLNGSQQAIKTYVLRPDSDPEELIEQPFELEGYLYTFADIVKEENHVKDVKTHAETVTVESSKNDLSEILELLAPTMEYDDGTYSGILALDHTSLITEASGYSTGTKTVSETKTIGPLDRNDMSYVPATTVKNGKTLTLANVDWQVIGTDMVGDVLAPASYQAVATYTGKTTYSVATGYVTTAQYVGEVSREGLESITYRLTYLGKKVDAAGSAVEELQPATPAAPDAPFSQSKTIAGTVLPYVLCGIGLLAAAVLVFLLIRTRREVKHLQHNSVIEADYDEMEED